MKRPQIVTLAFCLVAAFSAAACNRSSGPEPKLPTKASGTRDLMGVNPSQLLDELEKLPVDKRQEFLDKHEREMVGVTSDPVLTQRLQQIMSSN